MTDWSVIANAGRPRRLSHRRYRSCPIRHCEKPTGRNEPKHMFASSRREGPEPLMNLPPKEGVGNAGCPLPPRPRVHLVLVERTRVQRYAVKSVPDVATLILTTLTGAIGCRRINRS